MKFISYYRMFIQFQFIHWNKGPIKIKCIAFNDFQMNKYLDNLKVLFWLRTSEITTIATL